MQVKRLLLRFGVVVGKALNVAHMVFFVVLLAGLVVTTVVYIAGGPVVLALVRSVAWQIVAVCMAAFVALMFVATMTKKDAY